MATPADGIKLRPKGVYGCLALPRISVVPHVRGFLWIAISAVFVLNFLLYSPASKTPGTDPSALDWLFQSWPTLFAVPCAMWLLLNGPLSASPFGYRRLAARLLCFSSTQVFCMYFVPWPPFWIMMQSLGSASKNKETGVLVLTATMVWMIATVRHRALDAKKTAHPTVIFANGNGGNYAADLKVVENSSSQGSSVNTTLVRNGILLHGL